MAKQISFSDEKIAQALHEAFGVIGLAATQLGMTRQDLSERIRSTPALAQACREARVDLVRQAEAGLFRAVQEKKPWAIKFSQSPVGRRRGYDAAVRLTEN